MKIDGRSIGVAPLTVPLKPGKYHIEVSSLDSAFDCSFKQSFEFLPKVTSKIEVPCKPTPSVSLLIISDDPTATVYLNGEEAKKENPLTIIPGKYQVDIQGKAFGFGEYSGEHEFTAFQKDTVRADLLLDTATFESGEIQFQAIRIGDQWWMAKNMNNMDPYFTCYDDDKKNCDKFGGLYNWDDAMVAAAKIDGWKLPSNEDWSILEKKLNQGNVKKAGKELTSDGSSGFNADFSGYLHFDGDIYAFLGESGYFWTSTVNSQDPLLSSSRYIIKNNDTLFHDYAYKTYGFSVRLVKE